jgi:4-amino-4-deoxy-L-arabinose transferase-like glycosyltransferase
MPRNVLIVLGLALVLRLGLLPVLPLQDPDEGRYAQIAQEMVLSGDWVTPRLWHEGEHIPFLGKPPLQFWMAASCMKFLGVNKIAARLPGLLAAIGIVLLVLVVLRRYADRETAALAALFTASNAMFFALAGTAIVDMVLSFFVAGSLLAYFAFLSEHDRRIQKRWSLLVFVFLAGGFMTKGPVAIVLFGLPTLVWTAWHREWRGLREHAWAVGIPVFLLLTVPWFVLCELHNPGFLKYFFLHENLLRYIQHDYGDLYGSGRELPRGTALLMMLVAGLPWSAWAIAFLWRHRQWLRTMAPGRVPGLFLVGFAVNTLFWCLARQILWTYVLPLVPLFSVWLAFVARRHGLSVRPPVRAAAGLLAAYAVLASCLGPMALTATGKSTEGVLKRAEVLAAKHGTDGTVLFVRRTPYSAYFHARGHLLIHPKESAEASVLRGLARERPCMFVIKSRYLSRIPDHVSARVRVVDELGDWGICVPTDLLKPHSDAVGGGARP